MNNTIAGKVTLSLSLRHQPIRFQHLGRAMEYAETCKKIMFVAMGNDGYFWVVCPADGAKLVKAGYEYAH